MVLSRRYLLDGSILGVYQVGGLSVPGPYPSLRPCTVRRHEKGTVALHLIFKLVITL